MTHKLAYLAAAATLTFAGAAFAQTPPSPGSAQQTQTSPGAATTPDPSATVGSGAPATGAAAGSPSTGAATTTTPPADANSASGAATPSSANVAAEAPIGAQVKDPAGNVLGAIESTSTGADGATNVVVSSGGKKFALPKASLTVSGGAVSTTATKAQIDAALAATPK